MPVTLRQLPLGRFLGLVCAGAMPERSRVASSHLEDRTFSSVFADAVLPAVIPGLPARYQGGVRRTGHNPNRLLAALPGPPRGQVHLGRRRDVPTRPSGTAGAQHRARGGEERPLANTKRNRSTEQGRRTTLVRNSIILGWNHQSTRVVQPHPVLYGVALVHRVQGDFLTNMSVAWASVFSPLAFVICSALSAHVSRGCMFRFLHLQHA